MDVYQFLCVYRSFEDLFKNADSYLVGLNQSRTWLSGDGDPILGKKALDYYSPWNLNIVFI